MSKDHQVLERGLRSSRVPPRTVEVCVRLDDPALTRGVLRHRGLSMPALLRVLEGTSHLDDLAPEYVFRRDLSDEVILFLARSISNHYMAFLWSRYHNDDSTPRRPLPSGTLDVLVSRTLMQGASFVKGDVDTLVRAPGLARRHWEHLASSNHTGVYSSVEFARHAPLDLLWDLPLVGTREVAVSAHLTSHPLSESLVSLSINWSGTLRELLHAAELLLVRT